MARILYFGRLGDVAGAREREVDLPDDVTDTDGVVSLIAGEDDALAEALRAPSVRVMVNGEVALGAAPVRDGDEIAFLPPFSGG